MLLQIRDYLKKVRIASNQQIAREFNMDMKAVEPLLDFWLKKDIVVPLDPLSCKKPCLSCNKVALSYYQFKE